MEEQDLDDELRKLEDYEDEEEDESPDLTNDDQTGSSTEGNFFLMGLQFLLSLQMK